MAFELAFTTEDYDEGKSLLIVDACTDWASVPAVDSVTFTISSMYSEVVIGDDPLYTATVTVPIATVAFEEGFQYELTGAQIFGVGYDDTIPNSIYTIKMDLYNGAALVDSFTSNEVLYYDAMSLRDLFIAELASYDTNLTNKQMEYANWLDFLVTAIEANAILGNSSAIYFIFDAFNNISE